MEEGPLALLAWPELSAYSNIVLETHTTTVVEAAFLLLLVYILEVEYM